MKSIYRSTDVVVFDDMLRQYGKHKNVIKNRELLTVCCALDPFVTIAFHKLHGLKKFHVYIRKYIMLATTNLPPGTPTTVSLGKTRRKYTFPSLRAYALFFYNEYLVKQYRPILYVPKLPNYLMTFEPWKVRIEWNSNSHASSSEEEDDDYDPEDENFDSTGMKWGDIADKIDERREARLARRKKI